MGFLGAIKGALGAGAGMAPGLGGLANSKVGKIAMPGVGKVIGGQKMPAAAPAPAPATGGAVGAPPMTAGSALGGILGRKAGGMTGPLAKPLVGSKPVGFANGPAIASDPGMVQGSTPLGRKSVSKGRSLRGGRR